MYDVKESFVHPHYVSGSKVNDAGLVRLYSTLRFSSRVLPIMMAARDSRLPANQMAIVSGWGKLNVIFFKDYCNNVFCMSIPIFSIFYK